MILHNLMLMVIVSLVDSSPPGPPEGVLVQNRDQSFYVTWNVPSNIYGSISNYVVTSTILPSGNRTFYRSKLPFAIIDNADHPGKLFLIVVQAENEYGLSRKSNPKYIRSPCGFSIYVPVGHKEIFTSPHFPFSYESGTLCQWHILTNSTYTLSLDFLQMDFGETDNSCSQTSLLIKTKTREQRICQKHELITLKESACVVTFKSSIGKVSGKGFRIQIENEIRAPGPPTNVRLTAKKRGIILSWSNPSGSYLPLTTCTIQYTVLPELQPRVVVLPARMKWFSINTEKHRGQLYTFRLHCNIKDLPGASTPLLYFRAPCKEVIKLDDGAIVNITSPNFPGNYPSGISCSLEIHHNTSKALLFEFIHLDIQQSLMCGSDFLSFSFLPDTKICGVNSQRIFRTNSEITTITFSTDLDVVHSGFVIQVSYENEDAYTTSVQIQTESTVTTHNREISDISPFLNIGAEGTTNTVSSYTHKSVSSTWSSISSTAQTIKSSSSSSSSSSLSPSSSSSSSSQIPLTYTKTVPPSTFTPNLSPSSSLNAVSSKSSLSYSSFKSSLSASLPTSMLSVSTEAARTISQKTSERDVSTTESPTNTHDAHTTDILRSKSMELSLTTHIHTTGTSASDNTPTTQPTVKPGTTDTFHQDDIYYEPFIAENENYTVCVNLTLRQFAATTRHSYKYISLMTDIHNKLFPFFNVTSMFKDLVIRGMRKDRNFLHFQIILVYCKKLIIQEMRENESFHLIEYINATYLPALPSKLKKLENWSLEGKYLSDFRSSKFFAKQEISTVCDAIESNCRPNFTCVEKPTTEYGVICCRDVYFPCISNCSSEQVNYSNNCRQPQIEAPKKDSDFDFVTLLSIILSASLVVMVAIAIVFYCRKRLKVHEDINTDNCQMNTVQIYDIMLNSHYVGDKNVEFTAFKINKGSNRRKQNGGSLPTRAAKRQDLEEDFIDAKVKALGNFIDDKAALKQRLRYKYNVRRRRSL